MISSGVRKSGSAALTSDCTESIAVHRPELGVIALHDEVGVVRVCIHEFAQDGDIEIRNVLVTIVSAGRFLHID